MKKNKENFEEWLENSLIVADSLVKTANPHSLDFIRAMAEKQILKNAIYLYKKETKN